MTPVLFAGFLAPMKVNNEVFRELGVFLLIGAAVCAVLVFTGCSAPSVSAPASPSISIEPVGGLEEAAQVESRSQNSERASLSKNRPGLGTGWGRRINSSLSHTYFVRESNRPFGGVAAIYYNDKEGIEATAGPYKNKTCLLYTSPSPRDQRGSRMPSSA